MSTPVEAPPQYYEVTVDVDGVVTALATKHGDVYHCHFKIADLPLSTRGALINDLRARQDNARFWNALVQADDPHIVSAVPLEAPPAEWFR